jgi:Fe-coproporphyrin III synthase
MRSGFLPNRIIHLHPTRLCNLACLHCYSESGPKEKTALELNALEKALTLLKDEGYTQISLSGGEPLTYPHILPLVEFAREQGFKITMITNGLLPISRIREVLSRIDGAAISFDGMATTHNHLRGKADAFERASATLSNLAKDNLPIAAAISLTADAIPDLPDLAYHLAEMGAKVIQVRPVALAGRAKYLPGLRNYSTADQARLYLVVLALQEELKDQVKIHCDLAPARNLWQQRDAYAALLATCNDECINSNPALVLSDLVNPLVITETGILKPIAYDFNPKYNITTMEELTHDRLVQYINEDI